MKKGLIVGLTLGLVLVLAGGIWWWQQQGRNRAWQGEGESVQPATGSAGKLEFEVKEPSSGEVSPVDQKIEGEVSEEEINQLEKEIDQLLNDLNLEETPELDFEI